MIRKLRGQAFETMMLVISVIVAVAILGILISIITGLPIIGGDAKSDVQQMLKAVQNSGAGNQLKEKTQFSVGLINAEEAVQGTTINKNKIQFYCDSSTDRSGVCTGTDAPIQIINGPPAAVNIKSRTTASVAVCKGLSNPTFFICIGSPEDSSEVSIKCNDKCTR